MLRIISSKCLSNLHKKIGYVWFTGLSCLWSPIPCHRNPNHSGSICRTQWINGGPGGSRDGRDGSCEFRPPASLASSSLMGSDGPNSPNRICVSQKQCNYVESMANHGKHEGVLNGICLFDSWTNIFLILQLLKRTLCCSCMSQNSLYSYRSGW